ncbi:HNH endonuclease, partial [Tahibacter sp.]|uniref:HNH endonuclease n=1 Tax=Tahibacter sp. TaxID=2056211 RepID=UPI0028C4B994
LTVKRKLESLGFVVVRDRTAEDESKSSSKRFKHGTSRTWELALDAVCSLGGIATAKAVRLFLKQNVSGYKIANTAPDLAALSVNKPSRTNFSGNKKPRRTDDGNKLDGLYHNDGRYELYYPPIHGVWEIYIDDRTSTLRVRKTIENTSPSISDAIVQSEVDPSNLDDARERIFGLIVCRRGQPQFRQALLHAYGHQCAVTGCNAPQVLEAAHICAYRGMHTNIVGNGILLRADIHTLFDLKLISVNCNDMTLWVSAELSGTEFAELRGTSVRLPDDQKNHPSKHALRAHYLEATKT